MDSAQIAVLLELLDQLLEVTATERHSSRALGAFGRAKTVRTVAATILAAVRRCDEDVISAY